MSISDHLAGFGNWVHDRHGNILSRYIRPRPGAQPAQPRQASR